MKFILVNGRNPRRESLCSLCCEPIGESYLRELTTRLSFCNYDCYRGHCKPVFSVLKEHAEGITTIQDESHSVRRVMRLHQVCDHCGGPFGMVTHRSWGGKFCKRRCKDAFLREIMLGRATVHGCCGFLGMSWTLSSPEQKGSGGAPVINLTTSKALGIEPAQPLAPADEVIE